MKYLTSLIVVVLLVRFGEIQSAPIVQWQEELGNSWAFSCDFPNNDLSNVRVNAEFCSFKCRTTLGCTHYYWANYICYLKKNTAITKANGVNNNNQNTICGILKPG